MTKGRNFFEDFLDRVCFQLDGDFFLRAEALGAEQPVEADASVRERDEGDGMECPGKGQRGTRWHRGDVKKVGVWLQRCYLFSAALSKVQSSTGASDPIGSFFTYGTMGGMGLSRPNCDKYWKGWCRARKKEKTTQQKNIIVRIDPQKSPKGQQTPSPRHRHG